MEREKQAVSQADLIYFAPPFLQQSFLQPLLQRGHQHGPLPAQIEAFCDMWQLESARLPQPPSNWPDSKAFPQSSLPACAGTLMEALSLLIPQSKMLSSISYMAERLAVLKDFLKASGSIYLHCDPYANYYLRLLMDAVFGQQNFRNEITWKRATARNNAKRWNNTDRILYYARRRTSLGTAQPSPRKRR